MLHSHAEYRITTVKKRMLYLSWYLQITVVKSRILNQSGFQLQSIIWLNSYPRQVWIPLKFLNQSQIYVPQKLPIDFWNADVYLLIFHPGIKPPVMGTNLSQIYILCIRQRLFIVKLIIFGVDSSAFLTYWF